MIEKVTAYTTGAVFSGAYFGLSYWIAGLALAGLIEVLNYKLKETNK